MEIKTTVVRSIEFSASHQTANADPVDRESQVHGHLYRLTIATRTIDVDWAVFEEWVDRYLDMRDLAGALNFPTTPPAIASYLITVFAQLDPGIERLELQVDARDRVILEIEDTALIARRVHELDDARSRLHG